MDLDQKIKLVERRCPDCHRWYATEQAAEWVCGSCMHDRSDELHRRITELLRSNAALRGALRKAKA